MTEQRTILQRVAAIAAKVGASYAITGAHAVNHHVPRALVRTTIDVDVIVRRAHAKKLVEALEAEGYRSERLGDVVRFWSARADPASDPPIIDLVQGEDHPLLDEAVRSAREVSYLDTQVPIPARVVVIVLKFASAISFRRSRAKRLIDAGDMAHLVDLGLTPEERQEVDRLAELVYRGGSVELGKLIDDIENDRPITI